MVQNSVSKLSLICAEMCYQFNFSSFIYSRYEQKHPISNFFPKVVSMNCAFNFTFVLPPSFQDGEPKSFGASPHFKFFPENGVNELFLICAELRFQFYVWASLLLKIGSLKILGPVICASPLQIIENVYIKALDPDIFFSGKTSRF